MIGHLRMKLLSKKSGPSLDDAYEKFGRQHCAFKYGRAPEQGVRLVRRCSDTDERNRRWVGPICCAR
jgi:hypothetical protein